MARTFRRDPYALWQGKTCYDGHRTLASTPAWWVRDRMNKPKRRENARLCGHILKGADSENISWPLGRRKPHIYFW